MGKAIDLTGRRFGRLTVLKENGRTKDKRILWECICDCGTVKNIRSKTLLNGTAQSCGCLQKERASQANGTHKMRHTRLYEIWLAMRRRCADPNGNYYKDYGGRGITVCPEWADSFEAFRDWAMANGYRDDLTIDRKDTDGNYCPENCRWATQLEQQNNRRDNKILELNGESHTQAEWSRITGIKSATIHARLKKGWTVERALTEAVGQR